MIHLLLWFARELTEITNNEARTAVPRHQKEYDWAGFDFAVLRCLANKIYHTERFHTDNTLRTNLR
jgi:hypothetical protein